MPNVSRFNRKLEEEIQLYRAFARFSNTDALGAYEAAEVIIKHFRNDILVVLIHRSLLYVRRQLKQGVITEREKCEQFQKHFLAALKGKVSRVLINPKRKGHTKL